jgi:AcrR family transcriptional regulator
MPRTTRDGFSVTTDSETPVGVDQAPRTAQQRRTEATKSALLAAARAVLQERGYARATVAQIVRAAGRAHGTFYLYFDNKEEIYSALLEEMWRSLKDQSRMVWRHDTPLESVRVTVDRYVAAAEENVDLWRLLDDMSATNRRFLTIRDEQRRQFARKIARGIEGSLSQATLDGMNTEIVAELLAGMVDEACSVRFLRGRSWPREELVDHLVTIWGRAVGYVPNGVPGNSAALDDGDQPAMKGSGPAGHRATEYPPFTG